MAPKKQRRTADETRELMVEHGLAQLEREGVQFGLDHLSLDAACVATGVPRSSSHSAWSGGDALPQAEYQRAVLERWITEREGLVFAGAASEAVAALVAERGDELDRREVVRVGIQAVIEAAVRPDEFGKGSGFLSTDMALKQALASQAPTERDPDVAEWISSSEIRYRESRIDDTYRPLAALLGLVPRPEFGDAAFEHFSIAVASLVEGIALRHLIIPERNYAGARIADEAESGPGPATLLSVSVEALVDRFFEPAGIHG